MGYGNSIMQENYLIFTGLEDISNAPRFIIIGIL